MISRGYIKRVGSSAVDVLLVGSAATLTNVPLSGQIDAGVLAVGMTVLVDTIDGRPVVLHTVAGTQRAPVSGGEGYSVVTNNALLADGSVPLTGDLAVAPGVTVDGYDISTLGQAIDNLQAADTIARTGYTVLSHASHLVQSIGPDDSELLIRHGIFIDQEMLSLSNTEGQIEVMRVVGDPVATVDDRGALCYRYTVTRRVNTNPGYLTIGWAAATLVNGLTHKGYIAFDGRHTSPGAPSMRFSLITDVTAGTVEQIVRVGSLYNSLGLGSDDYGFAAGRLTTGDRYFAYNYNRNLLALRGADIEISDISGVPCFRVWGVAEDGRNPGDTRLGKASGGHLETVEDRVDFYAGSQRVMTISPTGTRFRGMIWSGDQPGPQVGIGEEEGQGLIAARNAAGVGQFVVRTGEINVHVHVGNPVEIGGYAQFADGNFTTDGIVRARAFELLGGGVINPGSSLATFGKVVAGEEEDVAVMDGEDDIWRFYAGASLPLGAPFRVSKYGETWLTNAHVAGEVTAYAGIIGGWTINSTYLAKDTGVGATSAGLAPNDYPFYAGATYSHRATAPFRVTPAGALTATAGAIGGWALGASALTGGNATLHSSGYMQLGTGNNVVRLDAVNSAYRLWVGNAEPLFAPFRVNLQGALVAAGATIQGTIYANAGHIDGSLYVGSTAPRLHLDGANKRIESSNFASGTSGFRIEGVDGSAEFNNVTVRGALLATAIQYGYVQATNGSIWVVKAAGTLYSSFDIEAGLEEGLAIDVEDPRGMTHAAAGGLWTVGDVVRLKDPMVGDFWATVASKTDQTTYWTLNLTYQSGILAGAFPSGSAVLNYGVSGDGVVRITADANNSPYISIATHAGAPWSSLTERARLGNLAGISGASGYGLWTDNGYFTGTVNANAGAIAGWNITPTKLYSEDVGAYAGVGMATYQDADQWAFWAGSHIPGNAEFRVSKYGQLYATSATITGTVTANTLTANSGGAIAGWTISSGHLYAGSGAARAGLQPATYPFYAGSETPSAAPFRVTPAGALTATSATITGAITANTLSANSGGSIAGWTISSGHLYAGSGAARAGMQPASYPFYAGSETPSAAPFRVTPAGVLTATNATISGAITASSGSISGVLNMGVGGSILANRYKLDYSGLTLDTALSSYIQWKQGLSSAYYLLVGYSGTEGRVETNSGINLGVRAGGSLELEGNAIYLEGYGSGGFVEISQGALVVKNDLDHDGTKAGFFGVAPASRPAAYTFTNGTTDRTINCDSTSVAELADVVYTMWNDLKNLGLLQ